MAMKLDSLIELLPGFKTAVNLFDDLERFDKCAGYLPTEVASEILLDLGENLHVLAGRRSRLITGTYGTGKSHLALVLANIYRLGVDSEAVTRVISRLRSKWPGKAEKLCTERRALEGDFLIVLLNGDEGSFGDSLLLALDRALAQAELSDLMPDTAFSAARARLAELRDKHPDTYRRAEDVCRDYGFQSISVLEELLEKKTSDAYEKFCKIHEEVCSGARFYHHHSMEPADVYQAAARRLTAEGCRAGIVVIWDEFGRYMERVLDDPSAEESRDIGRFAEACNASQRNQLHLYLICHRSLEEYAQISALKRTMGLSKTQQEDLRKERGRFRVFAMKTTDFEIFELTDQVINQRTGSAEWQVFASRHADCLDEWTDRAHRLNLFPDFSRDQVSAVVTYGSYPLHPLTAYALPRISERVARNEGTLFTFLSDSGSDTLGEYIRRVDVPDAPGPPPCLRLDELWEYFADAVSEHEMQRRVYQKYSQAASLVRPEETLEKRILKALALLLVIQSDRTPYTEAVLGFGLGLQPSEQTELREALKRLCNKTEQREAVLARNATDGSYRFRSPGSETLVDERIEEVARERARQVLPVEHLRSLAGELKLTDPVRATAYSDEFMLERRLTVEVVGPQELSEPTRWLRNLGAGQYRDGYLLIVICENSQEITLARGCAEAGLRHPQILIGIPKEPVVCSGLLRRHEALRYLARTQANLYGDGAPLREEWETLDREFLTGIERVVWPLFNPESRLLDWFVDGEEQKGIVNSGRLGQAASDMMSRAFPSTPRIAHERLTTEEGRDNFIGVRRDIIDKLLQRDGPEVLSRETSSQHKTVIDFVYKRTAVLVSRAAKPAIGRPDETRFPAMAAVWDRIVEFVDAARTGPQPLADLCAVLRRPPFGLRTRCLSLLAAAVFREHVLRGNLSLQQSRSRGLATRITRLDGAAIDGAFSSPDSCALEFTEFGEPEKVVVSGFGTAFGVESSDEKDPGEILAQTHEAIVRWWRGLPPFAQKSQQLDKGVLTLRDRVFAALAKEDADPQSVLVATALEIIQPKDEGKTLSAEAVADLVGRIKTSIEQAVKSQLHARVADVVAQVFGGPEPGTAHERRPLEAWYGKLSEAKQEMRLPGDAGRLAAYARMDAKDQVDTAVRLARDITGTPLEHWSDDMLDRFRGRLESAKRTVEEAEDVPPVPLPKPARDGQVRVTVAGNGPDVVATFTPVAEISQAGKNLQNILRNSVEGFKGALVSGELETILAELVRDFLK